MHNGINIFHTHTHIEALSAIFVITLAHCISVHHYDMPLSLFFCFRYCATHDQHTISELDITSTLEKRAPEPMLSVAVKQANGELVTGELNVSPGTQLTMEIFLDKTSAPVYGLGVSYMQVTDTKSQEETIIFNGYASLLQFFFRILL